MCVRARVNRCDDHVTSALHFCYIRRLQRLFLVAVVIDYYFNTAIRLHLQLELTSTLAPFSILYVTSTALSTFFNPDTFHYPR